LGDAEYSKEWNDNEMKDNLCLRKLVSKNSEELAMSKRLQKVGKYSKEH
jgi:hypothetical protein